MKIFYEIELLTPMITATAGTIGKDTDMVTKRDYKGNPYIPASHIKGILKERTEKFAIALNSQEYKEIMNIFGKEGNSPSKIRFSNLILKKREDLEIGVRHGIRIERKTKTAADNSLFSYETIPVSSIFKGEIEILESIPEAQIKLLLASLFHLGRIGGLKSRGLGDITLKIEGKSHKELDSIIRTLKDRKRKEFKIENKNTEFKKYNYRLEVEENLILKGKEIGNQIETRDSLQGSSLRGAVIGKLYEAGFSIDNLLDISLSVPFFKGEKPKLASVFKSKYPVKDRKNILVDKIFYDGHEIDGIKLERESLASLVEKTEDIGLEIERKTGTAREGQLFNSEIIMIDGENENNIFTGEIILTEAMAKCLHESDLYLGKKKLKGFGKTKIKLAPYEKSGERSLTERVNHNKFKNLVTFTALSDIILPFNEVYDICHQFLELLDISNEVLTPCHKKSFINMEKLPGYNITNNIRKSDDIIIKTGSVFTYHGDGNKMMSQLEKIEMQGVGMRKSEGFGMLEICSEEHLRWEVK